MHESPPPAPGSYPSRRSLREKSTRESVGRHGRVAAEASPIIPLVTTLAVDPGAVEVSEGTGPNERRSRPHRIRRTVFSVGALGGIAGLLLTMATSGLLAPLDPSAPAALAQQQRLDTRFESSGGAELFPDAIAESAPEDALQTFTNYADAEVQYPFASAVLLTDGFGERGWPVPGFHDAQDFAASFGTTVQAIADGTVLEAGWAQDGCGFGLKIQHRIDRQDVTSRYCHLWADSHSFEVGDSVVVGQEVGRVGSTGISFGPHLHFVVAIEGVAVDPMPFLLKYNRSTRP